jgi:hypothetical protein
MKQPEEGVLEQLQDRIYTVLRTKHDFQLMPIVTAKRSNFEKFCERLVGEGMGEGLFISPPLACKLVENVPGPVYEQVDFSVRIIENILTNRSGKSVILTAEKVTALLHLYAMKFGDKSWTISCRTKDPWSFEGDTCRNILTVHFTTMCSFN